MSRAIRNIEQRNQSIQQFFQPGMQAIHQASIEADKRNAQLKKADAKANRNLKVPMAPNNTAKLQDELWRKGAFKGIKDRRGRELTYEQAVDGIMGNMTKQAMANAEAMKPAINVPQSQVQQASVVPSFPKSAQKEYAEIAPEDRQEFAKWLYQEGAKHSVTNATDVSSALARNFTGMNMTIRPGIGTKQQAVALHLYDKDNITNSNDTISHTLGYIPGTDKYKWQQLNGGQNVHNERGLSDRAKHQPGEFLLGRYVMKETPDKYWVDNETYNFNNSGTEFARRKVESGQGTSYDRIRYGVGKYGANKDIPVKMEIPKSEVIKWYNQYKHQV